MSEHNNTVNQIRIRVFEIIEKSDKTDKVGIFFDWWRYPDFCVNRFSIFPYFLKSLVFSNFTATDVRNFV